METVAEPKIREWATWEAWDVYARCDTMIACGHEDTLEAAQAAALAVCKKHHDEFPENYRLRAWIEHMKCTLDEDGCQDKVLEYGEYRLQYNENSDKQWAKDE